MSPALALSVVGFSAVGSSAVGLKVGNSCIIFRRNCFLFS